jgi:hypothetical protein
VRVGGASPVALTLEVGALSRCQVGHSRPRSSCLRVGAPGRSPCHCTESRRDLAPRQRIDYGAVVHVHVDHYMARRLRLLKDARRRRDDWKENGPDAPNTPLQASGPHAPTLGNGGEGGPSQRNTRRCTGPTNLASSAGQDSSHTNRRHYLGTVKSTLVVVGAARRVYGHDHREGDVPLEVRVRG